MLKKIFFGVANFIAPPLCMNCGKYMNDNEIYICNDCYSKLEKISPAYNIVKYQFHENDFVEHAISLFLFKEDSPIQKMIHGLKYSQMRNIGRFFGRMIGFEISKRIRDKFDYIIPVPLHISKKRERTYNQSDFISGGISDSLKIDVMSKCLKRVKYTQTQTKLNREERRDNVRGAFSINKKFTHKIPGKNIILVDDVITTGATILECARILKDMNADKIIVCSIALAE